MLCPSDQSGIRRNGTAESYNLNCYNVNGQVFVTGQYPRLALMTDGTTNTVLFVEHLALCRERATSHMVGRSVWPAINLSIGDSVVYWPGAATTTSLAHIGFPGFALLYPTAMIPDPASGNVMSWKTPQVGPATNLHTTSDPTTSNSHHAATATVGLADGSVRGVSPKIALATWNAVLTPDGGEVTTDAW